MAQTHFGFQTVDDARRPSACAASSTRWRALRPDERPAVDRPAPRLEGLHRGRGRRAAGRQGARHRRRHRRPGARLRAQGRPEGRVVHTDINEAMLRVGRDRLLDAGLALPTHHLRCRAAALSARRRLRPRQRRLRPAQHDAQGAGAGRDGAGAAPGGRCWCWSSRKPARRCRSPTTGTPSRSCRCWASWSPATPTATATWPNHPHAPRPGHAEGHDEGRRLRPCRRAQPGRRHRGAARGHQVLRPRTGGAAINAGR
jgi:hypothetical protein